MSKTKDTQQHPNVEISVRNFGPIAEATINLRPLTVFIGPSNTGKTYCSTLVYALHNAFGGFSTFPNHLIQDLLGDIMYVWRNDPSEAEKESLPIFKKLNTEGRPLKFSDLPQEIRDEVQLYIEDPPILLNQLENCLDIDSPTDMRKSVGGIRNEMMVSLEVSEENQKFWDYKMTITESDTTVHSSIDGNMPLSSGNEPTSDDKFGLNSYLRSLSRLSKSAGKVYYLPATRSGIMQSHAVIASSLVARATRAGFERSPEIPMFPGGMADFLQQIILYKADKKTKSEMMTIADMLESNVLHGKLTWRPSPSGYPEFHYYSSEMEEEIRLSQASSMVSELAPLVLFIRGLIQPGDTLIIEEPEAHLHPGAQTEIATTLARLVRAGVRVVVTTHSDWLLKEIGNLIREGVLKEKGELRKKSDGPESWLLPDEVGAWHFHKEKPVERLHFTNIDGIEPLDYEDLAQDLYNRSAGLHNQIEETEGNNTSE